MPTSDPNTGGDWQRLHPAMFLFGLGSIIRGTIIPLLIYGAVSDFNTLFIIGTMVLFSMMSLLFQCFRYWSFRYRFGDGQIMIHEGLLSRKRRIIPVRRIHNINTSQNLAARLLGVVRLDIETAGGGETEASLSTISKAAAAELEAFVRSANNQGTESATPEQEGPRVLHRMSPREVFVAGATSNRIGVIAFGLLALSQYMEFTNTQIVPEFIIGQAEELAHREDVWLYGLLGFLALLLGAWLFGVAVALIRWHGFTLAADRDDLKIRAGLFTLREYTIPLNKVQALRCLTSPLRRPLGLFQIQVRSAGHVGLQEQSRVESDMLVPLTHRDRIGTFAAFAFPDSDWDAVHWHGVHVFTRTRQWLILLVLIAVGALIANLLLPPDLQLWNALVVLLAVVLSFGFSHINWRQTAYARDEGFVYIKSGFLSLHFWVIPISKIQNVAMSQTPGQLRRRLASLHIDVAGAGAGREATIPNIPLEQVWLMFNAFVTPMPYGEHTDPERQATHFERPLKRTN